MSTISALQAVQTVVHAESQTITLNTSIEFFFNSKALNFFIKIMETKGFFFNLKAS